MGVLATVLLVYLIGLAVSNIVGRKMVSAGESVLAMIPIVRDVYLPIKQFVQMMGNSSNNRKLKKTVCVRTPGSTVRVIGFVTGEIREVGNPVPLLIVFVPTSPNPTTGLMLMCEPEIVSEIDIKVETAMKMLLSGGIVAPDNFTVQSLLGVTREKQGLGVRD